MVNILRVGKRIPVKFTRGYGSLRMRSFVRGPLQCFNCRPGPAGTALEYASNQYKDNKNPTLKCVNCGQGHATTG